MAECAAPCATADSEIIRTVEDVWPGQDVWSSYTGLTWLEIFGTVIVGYLTSFIIGWIVGATEVRLLRWCLKYLGYRPLRVIGYRPLRVIGYSQKVTLRARIFRV